ncbi:hypothetical protein DFH01_18210 [Falsiroseomonas bella]|uniref:4-oxalocrotonate decarboxylase n=1 Tax=Falsiroseomonas bella TaxID=2184016 RepID=A0A317F8Z2_9PROT|nr:hypothetical protein [Falsiroseomonas bella]PWS35534.1 hypothetical protein DFH01_18210 [Falsiroseomonas bella]
MASHDPAAAGRWIAEAVETGNPLAPLPTELAPTDMAEAEDTALAVLEALGIAPIGLRLVRRPEGGALAGPLIEGRLLRTGVSVAPATLRHPQVTAAVIGVLAEPLEEGADMPPVFARLHPALDIAASRFTALPEDPRLLAADLARLGLVVVGRAKVLEPGRLRVALGPKGSRARGIETDLAAAFAEAAAAARRMGGLPAGALLVVAGLALPMEPTGTLRASFGALGAAEASFAVPA